MVEAKRLQLDKHPLDGAVIYRSAQRAEVIAAGDTDIARVTAALSTGPAPGGRPVWYQKHMSHHLLPGMDLAWVHGRLVFENCPLSQVLAEVQRYYPGWIINRNAQLENVAVTGNYRLDQPLETLRALAHITSAQLHEYPALVILN